MKKTGWFPGSVKPVRVGLYEQRYSCISGVSDLYFWNGRNWVYENIRNLECSDQNREWRGLTERAE